MNEAKEVEQSQTNVMKLKKLNNLTKPKKLNETERI
jgi:hypothetical protein